MDKLAAFHWANRRPGVAFVVLNTIGYLMHLWVEAHHPAPAIAALALVLSAGLAGLAWDLFFTKGEEAAGEID